MLPEEEKEAEEGFYKLLPANKADHLCHRMTRTTGVCIYLKVTVQLADGQQMICNS